jgi:N,N-dimethylformamidase
MIPLIGYGDRLSARPGETIEFKVSSRGPAPFRTDLVRIICADPNPAGPGLRLEPVDSSFAGEYPSRVQDAHQGSYARVDWPPGLPALRDFTLLATIWPTTPGKGTQGVVSCLDPEGGVGAAIAVGEDGGAVGILGQGTGAPLRLACARAMGERRWYRVWIAYDSAARRLTVGQSPLDATGYGGTLATAEAVLDGAAAPLTPSAVHLAALGGAPVAGYFNGKIERPQIFGRALAPEEIEAAARGEVHDGLVAGWDFSREIPSTRIVDTGPHGLDGALVNLPDRAMTGSNWTGREMCWRHAPEDYGAIHFHDDDLYDCAWQTDFGFTLPEDLPSGVYGARLACGGHEDTIPFFVCPPKGRRQADLCVVIPTFTYVIYGNHARPDFGAHWRERAAAWNGYPWNPADHPDFALSTYNFHSDGSGISHASRLRPLLTLRPGFISIAEKRGSGLRHFQADTHLLDWLEAKGYGYDVLTDEELHHEGAEALAGYRTVMTTSHPEYHSKETLDALEAYRDGGGRFVYLGGNGFYWRVALHSEAPGVLEIRRGEGGIRAWAAEPGEYYNGFDGAYGGLWRRGGRPPQKLAGIGFSAQGLFDGSHYRRTEAASDPRVAWIFSGINGDILGDFGLSGGGAAGYELDRADKRLGTPDHAIVVARSEGHNPETFVLVPEEHLTHVTTWSGEAPADLIRADMTFFETPAGGAVFSTGSITFCGSLPHNGYDNSISRILANVLDRFLDGDRDFAWPGG